MSQIKIMQAVILAAGRGLRMGKLTKKTPKPMLEIKGKPILAYSIECLPIEIDEVILVVGYLKEKIHKFFGDEYDGRKIRYVVQDKLNGTGGAIHIAKDLLKNKFLVLVGDDLYMKKDIDKMIENEIAVLTYEVNDPERFGIIETDNKNRVIDIIEKPKIEGPAMANVGMYVLNKDFFNYPLFDLGNGEYGLPQTLIKMNDKYDIKFVQASNWFPIGKPEDYERANELVDDFIK